MLENQENQVARDTCSRGRSNTCWRSAFLLESIFQVMTVGFSLPVNSCSFDTDSATSATKQQAQRQACPTNPP